MINSGKIFSILMTNKGFLLQKFRVLLHIDKQKDKKT